MKNLSIEWIVKQIYKHKFAFLLAFALSCMASLGIYKALPRKYKTVGKINVSPKYFQNPMMMDFLPTVYDANELRSEREAAITGSLSKEFLLAIIKHENPNFEKLNLLQRDTEIEKLKKNFEIFRENTTVFQIGAVGNTPEKSFELCNALMSEIIYKARTARYKYLEQLRDAVKARIQSLNGTEMSRSTVGEVKQQLALLEQQKKDLLVNFSPNHPEVTALTSKINALKKMMESNSNGNSVYNTHSIDPTQKANSGIKERLEEDLMKKYQNLEIVLDLENNESNTYVTVIVPPLRSNAAVSPQLPIFLAFGLLSGLFLGISIVAWLSREDMKLEMARHGFIVDPVTGKKIDRRNPNNKNKDFMTMDQ